MRAALCVTLQMRTAMRLHQTMDSSNGARATTPAETDAGPNPWGDRARFMWRGPA